MIKSFANVRFAKVKFLPAVPQYLTPLQYVDDVIDKISLVKNNQDKDCNKSNLTNINDFSLNTKAVSDNQVITKSYVEQFHQKNERIRRDSDINFLSDSSGLVKNKQDNRFNDYNLTKIDSVIINRAPTSDKEVSNKKYIDNGLGKNSIVSINQTL